MRLFDERVILRDFTDADISKRVYWETVETEWQLWDAPWEYEGMTDEQRADDLERYVASMGERAKRLARTDDSLPRTGFEIALSDSSQTYVGWCGSYHIDNDFNYCNEGSLTAIGIDLPDVAARNKGVAAAALRLFIDYLRSVGTEDIYTQTWSGNVRMCGLAEKIGFRECRRKVGLRTVRGKKYDGLTFKLDDSLYLEYTSEADAISKTIADAKKALNDINLPFVCLYHHAAATIGQCQGIGSEYGARHCKNLFLSNRQGNHFYLVLFDDESRFSTADVSKKLGVSRMSFADEKQLADGLAASQGSVSVLNLIHECAKRLYDEGKLTIAIDSRLLRQVNICVHPNTNTASFVVSVNDILRFITAYGYEYSIIEE